MEDALTEAPPPSRFFLEDLNNFTPPSPSLPSPFLLFSTPNPNPNPSLFIIFLSSPSLYLLHHIPSKTLIGTLILPEHPFAPKSISASPTSKSCNIYSLDSNPSILFLSIPISVSADRSHTIAKILFEKFHPEKVLILDSVQSRNFRGKLPPDEGLGFKLETTQERLKISGGDWMVKGFDSFPSGSVIDGLSAAILSKCEIRKIKGSLVVTWPESGGDAVLLVKSVIENVLPKMDFGDLGFDRMRDSRFDSELYT